MQGASPIDPALLAHIQSQHPSVNPDELAQIATDIAQALSQPDAGGAGGPPPGDPSAAPAGPGSSPEAPLNGIAGATDATKQASVAHRGLWMVKQAAYIYGFLGHALEKGASIEQAIELYRDALGKTAAYVERAEELEKISETIDDKTAEYCQGLAEQAQKRNLSVEQTIGLLKSSGVYDTLIQRMTSQK
jgi:hypothetical protein